MRARVPALVTLACALTLAGGPAAFAQGESAPDSGQAAKSDSAKAPAKAEGTKALGKHTAAAPAAAAVDAVVKSIDAQIAKLAVNKKDAAWRTKLKLPTVAKFDPAKSYYARMVTNKGTMLIKFKPDVAPMHVTNFIYLTRLGFYDGIKFHRVMKGFMAQGGDPLGNGSGGPGYQFAGEISPKATHNAPGVLSRRNAGPGTEGSQFCIMCQAEPRLNGGYTVFGQVEEGLETLKAIEAVANPGDGPPIEPVIMTKVTIEVR